MNAKKTTKKFTSLQCAAIIIHVARHIVQLCNVYSLYWIKSEDILVIVHGLKMFNLTSDTMMLNDACTCIFLIREVFHFALVDWSTLKFLQGKAKAIINHTNVNFICRVVGKYWFSGLLRYVHEKYHSVLCFSSTSLLSNMLWLGMNICNYEPNWLHGHLKKSSISKEQVSRNLGINFNFSGHDLYIVWCNCKCMWFRCSDQTINHSVETIFSGNQCGSWASCLCGCVQFTV